MGEGARVDSCSGSNARSLTGRQAFPHLMRRAVSAALMFFMEDTAFPASEGIHDPPGKRTADDSARAFEKRAATTQGPRGRCADPPGDKRATGSALLSGADRADPGFEPASGAATDHRSRQPAHRP